MCCRFENARRGRTCAWINRAGEYPRLAGNQTRQCRGRVPAGIAWARLNTPEVAIVARSRLEIVRVTVLCWHVVAISTTLRGLRSRGEACAPPSAGSCGCGRRLVALTRIGQRRTQASRGDDDPAGSGNLLRVIIPWRDLTRGVLLPASRATPVPAAPGWQARAPRAWPRSAHASSPAADCQA